MPTPDTGRHACPPASAAAVQCRRERAVDSWQAGHWLATHDELAEEVPVALVYNGASHAVMLATPADLEDFARGFTLTEGILPPGEAIVDVRLERHIAGLALAIDIAPEHAARLDERTRAISGRSGCGACGTRQLEQALRWPETVTAAQRFSSAAVQRALGALGNAQPLNRCTGGVHAAAWADANGKLHVLREDIGRHNALDKLVGALIAGDYDATRGFVVVTSRASYEMVQKTAAAGIGCLVAVSAATALAQRMAESAGITLLGFARPGRHVCYAHPWRLTTQPSGIDCDEP